MLKEAGLTHCLKLLHFHVGSQVPDISTIKRAVREGARYYAKLSKLGHQLGYLDVGGGLGVDYDGSRSDFDSSTNYSLQRSEELTSELQSHHDLVCRLLL